MSDESASYKSKCVRIICDKKCLGPVIMSIKYYTEPVGQFCEVQPINCKCVGQILPMCGPIFYFFFRGKGGVKSSRDRFGAYFW